MSILGKWCRDAEAAKSQVTPNSARFQMLLEKLIPPLIRFIQFISHLILILIDMTFLSPASQNLILLNRLLYTTEDQPRLYIMMMIHLQGSGQVTTYYNNIECKGHYMDI